MFVVSTLPEGARDVRSQPRRPRPLPQRGNMWNSRAIPQCRSTYDPYGAGSLTHPLATNITLLKEPGAKSGTWLRPIDRIYTDLNQRPLIRVDRSSPVWDL
jgi:hypothetical protein